MLSNYLVFNLIKHLISVYAGGIKFRDINVYSVYIDILYNNLDYNCMKFVI